MKNIYEVKVSKFNWRYILADSMKAIDTYCKENNFSDWRMVGMMSREEYLHIRKNAREI